MIKLAVINGPKVLHYDYSNVLPLMDMELLWFICVGKNYTALLFTLGIFILGIFQRNSCPSPGTPNGCAANESAPTRYFLGIIIAEIIMFSISPLKAHLLFIS